MPHYDYKCTKCGHTFEVFQKMSDRPLKRCPKCKGLLRRLIGAGCGLIFKGSGFYATDYKRNNSKETSRDKKDESQASDKQPSCPCGSKVDSQNCPKKSDKTN